ncbi:MAG: aldose 1-epimerase family protein [Lachnospiraceae bacterium]|nr:aldose 1-epimerase family protein [Lachnospiraceae bacterium]
MDKKELYQYVGSMQQVAYVRPIAYEEGRSSGLKAYEVKNGGLCFRALADKCLDVSEVSYKGMNLNFLSKPGLQGRGHYDTHGEEALRSIMGGFFFTAGLENICAPLSLEGKDYPMHGRIRTTPGEHLCGDAFWEDGEYVLRIQGEMREAELFGENMVLRRTIESRYGEKSFTVTDEITNEAYRREPLMLLYHINMGYPFLDENTRLLIPARKVTPRDPEAEGHEDRYDRMEAPKPEEPEYVFIHDLKTDENQNTYVCVMNREKEIGLKIEFNMKYLPYFMEWKSIAAGDYVIGLEPSNSSVYGKAWHVEHDCVHYLEPFASETNVLKFTIADTKEELDRWEREFKEKFAGIQ